jgi:hypothetical protein
MANSIKNALAVKDLESRATHSSKVSPRCEINDKIFRTVKTKHSRLNKSLQLPTHPIRNKRLIDYCISDEYYKAHRSAYREPKRMGNASRSP